MRVRTLLRTSPGVWLAPVLLLLTVYYIELYLVRGVAEPYSTALTARAIATLGFVAPICAAMGAWEGGRLRRSGWWVLPMVRNRLGLAARLIAPAVIAGTLAVGMGMVWNLQAAGLIVPDPRPVIVVVAVIVAHTSVGFAVGLRLPLVIALPGTLLGSLLWMVLLRALEPRWLMMLNGQTIELCCGRDTDIASAAILGPVIIGIALTLAAAISIALPHIAWQTVLASAGILGVGVAVGASVVSPLGADPTVARDANGLVCEQVDDQPEVCVWPEHRSRLPLVSRVVGDATSRWAQVGVDIPSTVSEGDRASADVTRIGFTLESTAADLLVNLAYGMLPPWPACAETQRYPGADAEPYLQAWLATVGGMERRELVRRWGDDRGMRGVGPVLPIVERVRADPPATQSRWWQRNYASMADCTIEPMLVPRE